MTEFQILHIRAQQIANLVKVTDVERRSQLYELVAQELNNRCQNHQASLFREISKQA